MLPQRYGRRMVRRGKQKPLSVREIEKSLLLLEGQGVLDRDICYHPILTDEEQAGIVKAPRPLPPRLLYVPTLHILIHCYGDTEFYVSNPEYMRGGLSKECIVLPTTPRHLDNYFAMEDTYRAAGVIGDGKDRQSLRATAPAPITGQEFNEMRRRAKQRGQERLAKPRVELTVVK